MHATRSAVPLEAGLSRSEGQRVDGQLDGAASQRGRHARHLTRVARRTGRWPDVACCSAAAILRACSGSTRVSPSKIGEQGGRVVDAVVNLVVRRVRQQPAELGGVRAEPYSSDQVAPEAVLLVATMSRSGAAQMTAEYRSGRCVRAAPTSSPPFEPPEIVSCAGVVTPLAINHSAAA